MKIYNPQGTGIYDIAVDDSSVRYRSIMTDDSLTLNFSMTGPITVPQFSYVNFESARYTLWRPQEFKKHSTRNHEYTLTLHGYREFLKFVKYKDMSTKPYRLKFSLTAKPIVFLQNLVACLNANDPAGGWVVGNCIDAPEKTLSFNHEYCIDVFGRIAQEWETEYEFENKTVHLRKVEKFKAAPLPLSYGKGNGFLPGVGRYNDGDKQPVGRLYVQGGERNIDFSTYNSKSLLLPKSATLVVDGKTYRTDADGMYITRDGGTNTAEDSYDASEIYPRRVGTVSEVVVVDSEKHFYDIKDSSIPEALNYRDCRIAGEKAIIKFESGALAGREFDIEQTDTDLTGYIHAERRFKIVPAELDGHIMPGGVFVPSVGDKYAIFNIAMPQAYISDNATKTGASWDMFREAVRYFIENEADRFRFTGELDGVWSKSQWLAIGGKIVPGGHVLFSDTQFQTTGVVIRIVAIKDYVNQPHKPEITLSNAPISGSFSSELAKLEADEVVIEESKKEIIRLTKRQWRDARETMEMLNASLLNFSSSINPITVQTMQLILGDESLQFRFVNSKTVPIRVNHSITFNTANKTLSAAAGILQHMSIGITTLKNKHAALEYKYWDMAAYTSPVLDASKAYYLYAKCSKTTNSGTFILSETAIAMEGVTGFYHLLVGILNSENLGERSFASLYGYTEITPGRVVTNRIESEDGGTFFDLVNGIIGGKIRFIATGGTETNLADWADGAAQDIQAAQSTADGKSTTYLIQPTSYKLGDMWVLAADQTVNGIAYKSGEILTATQDSTTYNQAHWVKKVRYTDKDAIDSAVNNLEIGGRNLILNSNDWTKLLTSVARGVTAFKETVDGESVLRVVYDGTTAAPYLRLSGIIKELGVQTFSVEAKLITGEGRLTTQINDRGITVHTLTEEWVRYSVTYNNDIVTEVYNFVNMYPVLGTGAYSFYLRLPKLEKGNKATDWSPAPEDVQAAIDAAVVKATYWSVKASAPVIYKDAINAATSGAHTPVTVSGELRSGTTTTSGGFITVTPNGGTEAGTASASPVTITPANGDGKTSYTVRLYDTAAKTTLLDTMTIPVVFKGASGVNAINVVLSNEADVLPASPEGVVSDYSGSGTTIRVFEGATELDYDGIGTANGKFNVTASEMGITAGARSESGLTCVFANASNMTADNATITFTISGKTADGASFSLTKTQSFAKSRTGAKGDAGISITEVDVEFSKNTNATTPPAQGDAGWSTTAPTLTGTEQLWTRTKTAYSSGNPTYSTPANITPKKGDTGAVGQGVESVTEEYAISTSKTTQPTTGWSTTQPAWVNGQYIWSRVKVVYKNPASTVYTGYAVSSEWEAVNELEIGGRNLFISSNLDRLAENFTYNTTKHLKARINYYFNFIVELEPDTEYVVSNKKIIHDGSGAEVENTLRLIIFNEAVSAEKQSIGILYSGSSISFKTNSNITQGDKLLFYPTGSTQIDFEVLEIKLEKGNKATDWTPAPEDVEAEIDTAKQEALTAAGNAQTTANSLKDFTDTAFRDGIIDRSESIAIEKYKNSLNEAMSKAEASYNKVYLNTYLPEGDAKTSLLNAKINLWGQRDTLLSAINTAISGGITTPAQKTAVDTAFANFNTDMTAFQNAIEEANKSIQTKIDAIAKGYVDNLEIGGRNLVLNTALPRSKNGGWVYDNWTLSSLIGSGDFIIRFKYTTSALNGIGIGFGLNGEYDGTFLLTPTLQAGSGYYEGTMTFNRTTQTHLAIYVNADTTISELMLVSGDKIFKDWSPAPEDIQASIDAVNTTAADAQAKANVSKAITDKFGTTATGGLINTVMTEYREADSEQVTGVISGIQGAGMDLPFLVAGGTYQQGIDGTAGIIFRHNSTGKIGVLDIDANGNVKIMDTIDPLLERLLFSKFDIPTVESLRSSSSQSGSADNAPVVRNTTGLSIMPNTTTVSNNGSRLTISGTLYLGASLAAGQTAGSASVYLMLYRNDEFYASIRFLNYSLSTNSGTVIDSVPISTQLTVEAGVYSLQVYTEFVNTTTTSEAGTSGTTNMTWSFSDTIKRFEYGTNGFMGWYTNNHIHFTETGGLDVRGATNMPGILFSAGVPIGGGIVSPWGAKQSSTLPVNNSTGRYTIYHTVGHTNYQVSASPNTANRSFHVVSKGNTDFVIEWRTIGSTPTLVNTAFDFQIIGKNYA